MLDAFCREHYSGEQGRANVVECSSNVLSELDEGDCLVHPFLFCPPLAEGQRYILVIRKPWGQRVVLSRRIATSRHQSLNLARVRQEGACLGANEVHVVGSKARFQH